MSALRKIALLITVSSITLFLSSCLFCNLFLPDKLTELDEFSSLTAEGTTEINIKYEYYEGEIHEFFEFTLTDVNYIQRITTAFLKMEIYPYPNAQDIDPYYMHVHLRQGDKEYRSNLFSESQNGFRYLLKSGEVRDIIEEYIETHFIPDKLVELEKLSSMTIDSTEALNLRYSYRTSETDWRVFDLVITDCDYIERFMSALYEVEKVPYVKDEQTVTYRLGVTISQRCGREYNIHFFNSGAAGQTYYYKADALNEIIDEYIEMHHIESQ